MRGGGGGGGGGGRFHCWWGSPKSSFFFFLQMNAMDRADVSMPVIHTLCKAIALLFSAFFFFIFFIYNSAYGLLLAANMKDAHTLQDCSWHPFGGRKPMPDAWSSEDRVVVGFFVLFFGRGGGGGGRSPDRRTACISGVETQIQITPTTTE